MVLNCYRIDFGQIAYNLERFYFANQLEFGNPNPQKALILKTLIESQVL